MKPMTILLAASLLTLALPVALADETGDCPQPIEMEQYIEDPTRPGKYFFIDVTDPQAANRLGEWTESNPLPGLQTQACFEFGMFVYGADTHSAILP